MEGARQAGRREIDAHALHAALPLAASRAAAGPAGVPGGAEPAAGERAGSEPCGRHAAPQLQARRRRQVQAQGFARHVCVQPGGVGAVRQRCRAHRDDGAAVAGAEGQHLVVHHAEPGARLERAAPAIEHGDELGDDFDHRHACGGALLQRAEQRARQRRRQERPVRHPSRRDSRQLAAGSPYSCWKRSAAAASRSARRVLCCGGVTCHRRTSSSASTMVSGQPACSPRARRPAQRGSAVGAPLEHVRPAATPARRPSGWSAPARCCRARRRAAAPVRSAYACKVTRLISASVVAPRRTRSSAARRRLRVPLS